MTECDIFLVSVTRHIVTWTSVTLSVTMWRPVTLMTMMWHVTCHITPHNVALGGFGHHHHRNQVNTTKLSLRNYWACTFQIIFHPLKIVWRSNECKECLTSVTKWFWICSPSYTNVLGYICCINSYCGWWRMETNGKFVIRLLDYWHP